MQLTIELSEANEATAFPWWVIVDPPDPEVLQARAEGDRGLGISETAGYITGPFFSRKGAQAHLDAKRHRFGPKAVVYCKSGHDSREYRAGFPGGKGF